MNKPTTMDQAFLERYRCPEIYADFRVAGEVSANPGFFRFGANTIGFGKVASGTSASDVTNPLYDAFPDVQIHQGACSLPFDPTDLVESLRSERYAATLHSNGRTGNLRALIRNSYYLVRPVLPVPVRRHLQRASLSGWEKIPFPSWPVDRSVERIFEQLLALSMKAHGTDKIPFIWYWPDGYSSCAILTHDVETSTGLGFCPTLADIDDSYGMKASFQIVPEGRYAVTPEILQALRGRGFEINVHDFNHDGHLFRERTEFLYRASRINHYAEQFGAKGFRSGALYRNLDWYDAFAFSYDMSVPNVGHLDPQRGGCCTVMPYFIGKILELPLTTTQDYALFHFLGDYSIALWQRQIDLIRESHGLISFLIHPDYIIETRARNTYKALLAHLSRLRSEANVWITLPGEVDSWWRQRSQMKLVQEGGAWCIEGPGKERARIAWATLIDDRTCYTMDQPSKRGSMATHQLLNRIVKEEQIARIEVTDNNGTSLGHLAPITKSSLADSHLIKRLTDWRNRAARYFFTQGKVTCEMTINWLGSAVLQDEARLLFVIYSKQNPVGTVGFKMHPEHSVELGNLVLGESGGGHRFIHDAQRALIDWIFLNLETDMIYGLIVENNLMCLNLQKSLGFKPTQRIPLKRTEIGGEVQLQLGEPGTPSSDGLYALRLELKRSESARQKQRNLRTCSGSGRKLNRNDEIGHFLAITGL